MSKYTAAARMLADAGGIGVRKAERILNDFAQTAARQPENIARAGFREGSSTLQTGIKTGGATTVGVGGLYFGGQAVEDWSDKEEAQAEADKVEAAAKAANQIAQNENLTHEQKLALTERLKEAVDAAEGSRPSSVDIPVVGNLGVGQGAFLIVVLWIVLRHLGPAVKEAMS